MSKQPYIPLYIGDWEQDTNCLTLDAEGALLKLIFKLWKSDDKGRAEFSFSQLSILFKKSEECARKIVSELHENKILNIEFIGNERVKFESRRILKDTAKSLTYSTNGAKGGRPTKAKQKLIKSKTKAKQKLIPDIDIDNVIDNVIEIIPENWDKSEFSVLLKKWIAKRKRKPDADLARLRVSELIEKYPNWPDARKAMTEAASEGWMKFVYTSTQKNETISNVNRPNEEFVYDVL
jgi:uncharacterized protein YdaU (DUF1376 family)